MNVTHLRRMISLAFFLFMLFALLVVQFYRLQIVEGEHWLKIAKRQHEFVIKEPSKRGVFYSNTSIQKNHPEIKQPFVIDVPKFHLFADPFIIPEKHHTLIVEKLQDLLPNRSLVAEKLFEHLRKKSRSRKLSEWLTQEEYLAVKTWWEPYARKERIPLNALYFTKHYHRSYPFGSLLGSVLHAVRQGEEGESIPTGGLELVYDDLLKGKDGERRLLRSPRHALDHGLLFIPPEDGADVYLTINHIIQAIAEEEVEKTVKRHKAKAGWAVMMDPHTGSIIALAQYPSFDPANYRKFYNDPELVEHTRVKAINDCYEMGSTMKPITVALALKANKDRIAEGKPPLFDPLQMIEASNGKFPGRSKPISDIGYHNYLNMPLAMFKSANIYFARLIQKLVDEYGNVWYREQLQNAFGFGIKTGVEIPGESPGFLPRPGKTYPSGHLEWSIPTPFSLAIGYNLLVNTMQTVRAYAMLVNGGHDVRPTLIQKIVKTDHFDHETLIYDISESIAKQKQYLDPQICSQIINSLKAVTKPGGSGHRAKIPGFTAGGKTSTSEKIVQGAYSKKDHTVGFMGFAPASDPKFVTMVVIDDPEYTYLPGVGKFFMGGHCAAPAFRRIMSRTFEYLGIPPDDPHSYPLGDPRHDPKKEDWSEEMSNLRSLYQVWNQR